MVQVQSQRSDTKGTERRALALATVAHLLLEAKVSRVEVQHKGRWLFAMSFEHLPREASDVVRRAGHPLETRVVVNGVGECSEEI